MSNIQKRGGYTPRRVKEQRAYRLVVASSITGTLGIVGLVLAIAGVIGAGFPVALIVIAIVCFVLFRGVVS